MQNVIQRAYKIPGIGLRADRATEIAKDDRAIKIAPKVYAVDGKYTVNISAGTCTCLDLKAPVLSREHGPPMKCCKHMLAALFVEGKCIIKVKKPTEIIRSIIEEGPTRFKVEQIYGLSFVTIKEYFDGEWEAIDPVKIRIDTFQSLLEDAGMFVKSNIKHPGLIHVWFIEKQTDNMTHTKAATLGGKLVTAYDGYADQAKTEKRMMRMLERDLESQLGSQSLT